MVNGFDVRPGDVFHLWCTVCRPPKFKFYVVAYTEPRVRYMLINSAPAPFQREKDELMQHQLVIRVQDHPFLQYDSYLDCSGIIGGPTLDELAVECQGNPRTRIGALALAPRAQLREIVVDSRVLTGRDKRLLLESW